MLENICRAFLPSPTDCPWVSGDAPGPTNRPWVSEDVSVQKPLLKPQLRAMIRQWSVGEVTE